MTADLSAALDRTGHVHFSWHGTCAECGDTWPCEAVRLAAVVRAVLGVHVKTLADHSCAYCHGKDSDHLGCTPATPESVRDECAACEDEWPCATVRAATKAWEDGR